jgi:hypothetical protein
MRCGSGHLCSSHRFSKCPGKLFVPEVRRLVARGHQVSPWAQCPISLDHPDRRTKAPTEPVPLHGTTGSPSDRVPDPCPISVVMQIYDRHRATSGAPSGPPQRLERCPVGYSPGHAGSSARGSGREPAATSEPACPDDRSSGARRHPVPETVILRPLPGVGLVGALHSLSSFESSFEVRGNVSPSSAGMVAQLPAVPGSGPTVAPC